MNVSLYRPTLVHPCVGVHWSSSLLYQQRPVLLVHFTWMVCETGSRRFSVLYGIASKICSKQPAASLCSSHLAFSTGVFIKSKGCNYGVVLIWLRKIPVLNWWIYLQISDLFIYFTYERVDEGSWIPWRGQWSQDFDDLCINPFQFFVLFQRFYFLLFL